MVPRRTALGVGVLLAAGCSIVAPTPPRDGPRLIPLREFFASSEATWGHRISPDGARLAWLGSYRGRATIHVRTVDGDDTRAIVTNPSRTLRSFMWAGDSRHLLYYEDNDGNENYHVHRVSAVSPDDPPVDLTPVPGSRAWVVRRLLPDRTDVVVAWNTRERTLFDLYRVNVVTGAHELIAENPGDVIDWMVDAEGRARARIRHAGPLERRLEVLRDGTWMELQRLDLEEFNVAMLGVTPDDRGLWLLSSHRRDRRALVRVDVATGRETLVHEDPTLDVEWVDMDPGARLPLAAFTHPGLQSVHFFDAGLEADVRALRAGGRTGLRLLSSTDDERSMTAEAYTEKGSETFLMDRRTKDVRLLASHMKGFADAMATTEPITLTARDGLRLHGYLTRPPGFRAPGPTVLHVHGGHWARDYWGYTAAIQFLANRGYAVLQVNYRGSTGYGRAFRELAIGQYAGAMHDDLVDAVRWAVQEGIADPARVAIYGGSYGGYASLVGMTFTPDVFACGVDVVGIANWLTFYETVPAYWRLSALPLLHKYVGDPSRAEDRVRLHAISPIFKVDRVKGPILIIHGAQDPRVGVGQSEAMAKALERAGKQVRLVVFPDEGHRREYGNWRNAIRHYEEVERFLAACIGGRR